ncbi:MAG TPA: class I SAM-dependent methyltransferase [Egibacteraceae bacterium]|jgi:SAM-dependent methyltransferase|nr:class I SAM-dependent methyltransferase [Egibacteraceae bacterium]
MADGHDPVAGGVLVGAMWSYAATVLYPAQALKRTLGLRSRVTGEDPVSVPRPGLGPRFSVACPDPVVLDGGSRHDHLVAAFDQMAEIYEAYVQPFSRPIVDEALDVLAPLLPSDARVLDLGCGPGRELQRLAGLVPRGEVVGVDLAAGMVVTAHRAARAHGLDHTAFFQADAGDLPPTFAGAFDAAFTCLAHHHFPEPARTAAAVRESLRPGGIYAIVDPGPAWYNAASAPLARRTDPGWVGFHTPDEFRGLLADAGFARASWREVLPGFGLVLAQRAPAEAGGGEAG